MVKLHVLRVAIGCLSVSLMIQVGALVPTLNADIPPTDDMRCVTLLEPKTCSNGGNSMCDGENPCSGSVNYCSSTQNLPNKGCAAWEGDECTFTGEPAVNCAPGDRKSCSCTAVGDPEVCRCPNPQVDGPCGGDANVFPCSS